MISGHQKTLHLKMCPFLLQVDFPIGKHVLNANERAGAEKAEMFVEGQSMVRNM